MRTGNKIVALVLVVLIFVTGCTVEEPIEVPEELKELQSIYDGKKIFSNWYDEYHVIAHALGGIDGIDYTNSYEAFLENYDKGTRIFEVDLQLTTDNEFVLVHEWDKYCNIQTNLGCEGPVSSELFMDTKIHDNYTPLSLVDLLQIMQIADNFYVVIDSKTFNLDDADEFYAEFVKEVNDYDEALLERFIPQAYSPEMYTVIKEHFKNTEVILTLYAYYVDSDGQKIYQEIKERGIKVVVMHMDNDWASRVIRDIKGYALSDNNYENIRIYIHTVNDYDKMKSIVNDENFFGIYSDYIGENDFIREFK